MTGRLRQASWERHEALEGEGFGAALAAGELAPLSFVGFMRAMQIVLTTFTTTWRRSAPAAWAEVWEPDTLRLELLNDELAALATGDQEVLPAVEAALQLADQIILLGSSQSPGLLGCGYVLEGSSLGGPKLAELASRLDLGGCSLRHLTCHGDQLKVRWEGFVSRLNAVALLPEQVDAAIAGTWAAYDGVAQVMAALHPLDHSQLGPHVVAINPEAGRHAVPRDVREREAARIANQRCLERFPYYGLRYGARGQRFGESDGAWLVTLIELSQVELVEQVDWLADVLAARGMPSFLLEEHLGILHEELAQFGADTARYDPLLAGAAALRDRSRQALSDTAWASVVEGFQSTAPADELTAIPEAGQLLAGALADERSGRSNAIASLLEWLADETRFSKRWVRAARLAVDRD